MERKWWVVIVIVVVVLAGLVWGYWGKVLTDGEYVCDLGLKSSEGRLFFVGCGMRWKSL